MQSQKDFPSQALICSKFAKIYLDQGKWKKAVGFLKRSVRFFRKARDYYKILDPLDRLIEIFREAYEDLSVSVDKNQTIEFDELRKRIPEDLDAVKTVVVNSEREQLRLVNDKGELRLSSRYTVFIGGQILDRAGRGKNLKLTIHFSDHGQKKILPSYTKLSVES